MFSKIKFDFEDENWIFYTYGGHTLYNIHDELDGYILINKKYLEEFKNGNKMTVSEAQENKLMVLANASSFLYSERYRNLSKEEQETAIDPEISRHLIKIIRCYIEFGVIYLKDKIPNTK